MQSTHDPHRQFVNSDAEPIARAASSTVLCAQNLDNSPVNSRISTGTPLDPTGSTAANRPPTCNCSTTRYICDRSSAEVSQIVDPTLILDAPWLEENDFSHSRLFTILKLFLYVGYAFRSGRKSRNKVSRWLTELDLKGKLADPIPVSPRAIHECCSEMERIFGAKLQLSTSAKLFVRQGDGKAWSGFTELGVKAWVAVHHFLGRAID